MWLDSTAACKESDMPTAPRRPQAERQRQQLHARRLRAAELFAGGIHPAEVARQLGVSRQSASTWQQRWKAGGPGALSSRGPTGPTPRLSDTELARLEQALEQGAVAHGFEGQLWTLERIAEVIQRLCGARHHPAHVWAILRYRMGWSVQRPQRRAVERDQAAIDHWVKVDWPRIKKTPGDAVRSSASSTSPA
jgi:transposase